MKITIPVDEKNMETTVWQSFGRTPYFLIYDTDTKEGIFLDNSAVASQGEAGIKAAQAIVDNKVNVLITPRCGQNAADVLNSAGIQIYKTINQSTSKNIKAYNEGKLLLLNEIHTGFHNHGGN